MNYRRQLFSLSGLHKAQTSFLQKKHTQIFRSEWKEPEFFRSWMEYEFDFQPPRSTGAMDWNRLLGLSLAFSIGAGFWTAAGLLIAYLW